MKGRNLFSCSKVCIGVIEITGVSVTPARVSNWLGVEASDSRYTPVVHSPCSGRLFRVVCDVWAKAVNCPSEVVIRTADDIPFSHEWFEGLVDNGDAAMK